MIGWEAGGAEGQRTHDWPGHPVSLVRPNERRSGWGDSIGSPGRETRRCCRCKGGMRRLRPGRVEGIREMWVDGGTDGRPDGRMAGWMDISQVGTAEESARVRECDRSETTATTFDAGRRHGRMQGETGSRDTYSGCADTAGLIWAVSAASSGHSGGGADWRS